MRTGSGGGPAMPGEPGAKPPERRSFSLWQSQSPGAESPRVLPGCAEWGSIPQGSLLPPGWLARPPTRSGALGLEFTEDASSIHLLSSAERVASPVVRWSSRTPLRAWGSSAVAAARWRLQRDSAWPRLALHPQDLDHSATARSLAGALDRWCEHRTVGRYADLCSRHQPA